MIAPAASGRWNDLRKRLASAVVMLLIGIIAVWTGGVAFALLSVAVSALMVWELAAMTRPDRPGAAMAQGIVAGLALAAVFVLHSPFALVLLLLPSIAGMWRLPRGWWIIHPAYAFAIMLTGYGLVALRAGLNAPYGFIAIGWIFAVVIVSDVAGYFVGRALGGPKFWPRVSPKKTWSGTVAGWAGAVIVGLGFVLAGAGGWGMVVLSPLLAFAGQMGDIAESGIKRRAGIKDSSALIPGHGGVLDRFDALIGAVLMVLAIVQFGALPF